MKFGKSNNDAWTLQNIVKFNIRANDIGTANSCIHYDVQCNNGKVYGIIFYIAAKHLTFWAEGSNIGTLNFG